MKSRLIEINAAEFERHFEKRGFYIRHNLAGNPLFSLPRLIDLSKSLPPTSVEYNAGNVPVSFDPANTPRTGLSVEETIRRIEECSSWMVIKNVEQNPEYQALLFQCLDEIREFTEPIVPGMQRREGFIFISSPNSVTPFHLDPEHNFLLQIHGSKTMYQFTEDDKHVITEKEVEVALTGPRIIKYEDQYQKRAREFVLNVGEGLSVPLMTPHWVKNGPTYSVSLSVTFRSDMSLRKEALHRVNGVLRKTGIDPKPVGKAPVADTLKYAGYKTAASVKKVVKKKS